MEFDNTFEMGKGVRCFHTVCIGPKEGNGYEQDECLASGKAKNQEEYQSYLDDIHAKNNLTVCCHPQWCSTPARYFENLKGNFAMEIWNSACAIHYHMDNDAAYWDEILGQGKVIYGVAADDAHGMTELGKGWVMVRAENNVNAILDALRNGAFFLPVVLKYTILVCRMGKQQVEYSENLIKVITPLGYMGTAKYCISRYHLPFSDEEMVAALHETLYPAYRDEIMLKPGVSEYLHRLKEQGHSLNVLSASPYKMVSAVLKRCGVYELFDHVWSCEDFGMTKGEPEIYLAAVKEAGGIIKDSFFFDDNLEVIKTVVKAGIYAVGVYDDASADYVDEIQRNADKFIYSFAEL